MHFSDKSSRVTPYHTIPYLHATAMTSSSTVWKHALAIRSGKGVAATINDDDDDDDNNDDDDDDGDDDEDDGGDI